MSFFTHQQFVRGSIVIAVFIAIAGCGIALSLLAPYQEDTDELTYLVGTIAKYETDLPDAYLLQAYDTGPYLYPYIMVRWYEQLGHDAFKSTYLFALIVATGSAAYFLFRTLGLSWIPSLSSSVVLLMPRFSSGLETFGVLTFREAQGRAMAVPFFLVATAFIVRRLQGKRALWPVFGILGLCVFLHPVTVMLYAFVALIGSAAVHLFERISVWRVVRDTMVSGAAFVIGGLYFFLEVFQRLVNSAVSESVSTTEYVEAVVARVAWEFPAASIVWFRHMGLVSAVFVLTLAAFYMVPRLRAIRERRVLPYDRSITVWGIVVAMSALTLCLVLPGLNLYFMTHFDAPYIFQQWSRVCKFYYLGLFVAFTPIVYALWGWFRESTSRVKYGIAVIVVATGITSSSFGLEVAQFAVGYTNFESAYVPQAFSGIPDTLLPYEYQEVCSTLQRMGATKETLIVSGDFALRYYCTAHLYVTDEEGGAYLQLHRADLVAWYSRLQKQSAALKSGNTEPALSFAREIEAGFIVLPKREKYAPFEELKGIIITTRHIVVPVR